MAKNVAHAGKSRGLSSGNANENERRGWTEESYRRKNEDSKNQYDFSRRHLNFEIIDGKVCPLGKQKTSLYSRYLNILKSLDFREYKDGASNAQNTYVELILSGSRDRIRQIAFGDQQVDFEKNPEVWKNWGITRSQDIEQWALDSYNFACERFGKENIIGFEVHLDESSPHIHVNIVPTATMKQRGNVSGYHKVDADGNPVTYTKGKHIGEVIKISESKYQALSDEKKKEYRPNVRGTVRTISYSTFFGSKKEERSQKMTELHDKYYQSVGIRWGFARGDRLIDLPDDERKKRKHKSKEELENERLAKENKKLAEKNAKMDEEITRKDQVLKSMDKEIDEKESKLDDLNNDLNSIDYLIQEKEEKIDSLSGQIRERKEILTGINNETTSAKKELERVKNESAQISVRQFADKALSNFYHKAYTGVTSMLSETLHVIDMVQEKLGVEREYWTLERYKGNLEDLPIWTEKLLDEVVALYNAGNNIANSAGGRWETPAGISSAGGVGTVGSPLKRKPDEDDEAFMYRCVAMKCMKAKKSMGIKR